MTVTELARLAMVPPKEVLDDLNHLARSLRHEGERLLVHPAVCRGCGFTFAETKLKKPGKCPKCRGTWIAEPRVEVVS